MTRAYWGALELPPQITEAVLDAKLVELTEKDELWLRQNPRTPWFYESGIPYKRERPGEEKWLPIPAVLAQGWGDCLPATTLVLRDDYSFAPIASLVPGDRIMGDGACTTVVESAITGEKPILCFDLANGGVLRCSPDHRLFLADDTEVRAEDVKVGDSLRTPSAPFECGPGFTPDDRIPAEDLAWLVGAYVADGWVGKYTYKGADRASSFSISGFDDRPKRGKIAQKERVQSIAEKCGLSHSWRSKCVRVNDASLAEVMFSCGHLAPNKRVPSMRWTRPQVEQLILGLQADCSTSNGGTLTHGTVSPELALQLRVLYRMVDQSVHIKRWDEHGGLGENPIYRIGVRRTADETDHLPSKTRAENLRTSVRVRGIRESDAEVCADIETDSGRFYLPESDVVVHNCEDLCAWRAAELRVRGDKYRTHKGQLVRTPPERAVAFWVDRKTEPQMKEGQYHIRLRRADGTVEDPSKLLGMYGAVQVHRFGFGPTHRFT